MRKINVLCIRSNGYFQVFRVAPLINRPQYLNSLNALFANPFRNANLSESVDTWNCNVDESIYNNTSSDFFLFLCVERLCGLFQKSIYVRHLQAECEQLSCSVIVSHLNVHIWKSHLSIKTTIAYLQASAFTDSFHLCLQDCLCGLDFFFLSSFS